MAGLADYSATLYSLGMDLVWTRNNKQGVDTIHRAGCRHNLRPDRHTGAEPARLSATDTTEAQREIARCMGWDNWPDQHDAEFDIRVAPCARA